MKLHFKCFIGPPNPNPFKYILSLTIPNPTTSSANLKLSYQIAISLEICGSTRKARIFLGQYQGYLVSKTFTIVLLQAMPPVSTNGIFCVYWAR